MQIVNKFSMDLQRRNGYPQIDAVQNEANTRAVKVLLTDGGTAWTPPTGSTVSLAYRKADKTSGWYDKLPDGSNACSVSGNEATVILAPQVLTAAGMVRATIVFQDANLNRLATFPFCILVEADPAAGGVLSNDYYAYSTMEDVGEAVDAMLGSLEDTKAQLGQLVTEVNEAVAQVSQEAGPAIVCEESGETVAVADASARTLQGLTIYGKTTQNGTPSPSNPVPLVNVGSGGSIGVTVAGKNLLVNTAGNLTANGVTFTVNEDKSITISGVATGEIFYPLTYNTALPGGKYFLSGMPRVASGVRIYIAPLYHADYGDGYAFNVEEHCVFEAYIHVNSGADCNGLTIRPQIEVGMSATAYEPYKEQTISLATPNGLPGIPVASGGNYTDSNGQQWVCDEIDLVRGVYVQRVVKITSAQIAASNGYGALGNGVPYLSFWSYGIAGGVEPISSAYIGRIWSQKSGECYCSKNGLTILDSRFTDQNTAIEIMTAEDTVFLCPLTTPIETPLDADTLAAYVALRSNKPNTTVLNDAGAGQRLAYVADTKAYIDRKFTELQSAIIAAGANI